jgi:hypothetical protein
MEIKCQLDATDEFLLQILLLAQIPKLSNGKPTKIYFFHLYSTKYDRQQPLV